MMDEKVQTDAMDSQSESSALFAAALPIRRRSKMACDTCHYRKIKCNVEKCYPCKNCEKNAVQCTMVGPSMRPPRAISGSSSAAAAAAVAMAMATVASARLSGAPHGLGFEGTLEDGRSYNGMERSSHSDDPRSRLAPARLDEYQHMGFFSSGPVLRRASASARTSDDGSGSSDHSRPRRKLQSYSSSPSSLRNLFVLGSGGQSTLRSPSPSPFAVQSSKPDATASLMRTPALATSIAGRDFNSNFKSCGNYNDYLALQPSSHSTEPSSAAASSPSGRAVLSRGGAVDDTRFSFSFSSSQPALPSSFSSLPPTPTHPSFTEDSGESKHVSPSFSHNAPTAPFHSSLVHPSYHRANGHFLKHHLHRAPYTHQVQYSRGHILHSSGGLPDRRSSLPWNVHISSVPISASDARTNMNLGVGISQPPTSAVDGPALSKSGTTVRHKSLQQQYIPPQPFLVRSNSTPAIFSSIPSRSVQYSGQQSHHQQHGSNLFSPTPHRVATLAAFPKAMCTSVDPTQNSVPFLHPHDTACEMPGHPLDMVNGTSERSSSTQQSYGSIDSSLQESANFSVKEEDDYADGQNRQQAIPVQTRQHFDNINLENHREQPTPLRHFATSERSSVPPTSEQNYRQSYTTPFQLPGAIESARQGQVQQLKTEQMDDNEAFDSSLAMVLDDHLSLMDHLDMMPDIQVYRNMSLPPSIQHPFHGSDSSRNRALEVGYCSEAAPATNPAVYFADLAHGPSDVAAVKQEEFTDEDPMLYFDGMSSSSQGQGSMTVSLSDALTSASNTRIASVVQEKGYSTPQPSFGFMQGNGQHIKLEPSFPEIQRPPLQYAEPSYHPLEQQHPLDMGPIDMTHRAAITNAIPATTSGFGSKAQLSQHQQRYS